MLKTLLTSASLSLALLFVPLGSVGPLTTSGTAGLSPAHAEYGFDVGGIQLGGDDDDGPTIGFGIGGGDGEDDDDDGDDEAGDDDDGGDED
jgi:hypothetical protein